MATIQKDFLVKNGFIAGGQGRAASYKVTLADEILQATSNVDSWFYDKELSISAQETEARDLFFKSDGTKLYVLGNAGDDITEYNLSTAWDITTASVGNTFSVATQETTPHGLFFKGDGTSFYICGVTTVYQYNMSTAWDISTASYANKSFSVSSQDANTFALHFSTDGTKMFTSGSITLRVYQYTLSTAWDVSTASYASKFLSLSSVGTAPQGLTFNSDGTSAYVLFTSQSKLAQYNLSTAWDISTGTYVDYLGVGNFGSTTNALLGLSGVYYNSTAGKGYLVDYNIDKVIQLNVSTPSLKISGNRLTFESDISTEGHASVEKNFRVNGSTFMVGELRLGTGAVFSGSNVFSWASTSANFEVISQTTGAITLGGTAATGAITLGRSTVNQTVNIASGATASGSTKTLNIGTSGVSGSTTTITVGSSTGTSNTTINGNTTLGSAGSNTTTIASQLSANNSVGSAGQVLTSRGANQSPEWTTVSGGGGGTTTYALTIGTGLSGTSFNGSAAVTIAIDSTVATLTGSQTLTNKTLDGASNTITNIANSSLTNSAITINGSSVSLGSSTTITASTTNALTIGTGLSGTSFNGGSAVTIAIDSTVATLTGTQTLTNKTLTSPTVNGGSISSLTGLSLRDTSAAFDVTVAAASSTTLTAGRTLTLDMVNGSRTLKLAGNLDIAANLTTTTGAITLAGQAGGSSVTLPSSGTLATLAGSETLTNKTIDIAVSTGNVLSIQGNSITSYVGSGANVVLSSSPTITNLYIPGTGMYFNGSTSGLTQLIASATASGTLTLPATTGTLATLAGSEALTNKTVNGLTISTTTGTLTLANGSTLATSGANSITLTSTGTTSVTLPTTGTLATLAGSETFTNKTLTSPTISGGSINNTPIGATTASTGSFTSVSTTTGNVTAAANLVSNYQSGDEGGEITLNKPVTNTNITTGVTIDVYQDRVRIFESGGTSRGAYIDLTACSAGAGTNLLSGGSSGVTITDDTSTNATRYLTFTDQTSGTETTLNVASTKLTYNPSTGALSSTDFNSTSDAKLKKNVVPAKGLEVVNKLHGYEFDFIDNGMHASGVIAQEIEEVLPHLVKDNIDHKTVAYMQIIPYLIESIKELSQEVNTLKNKLGYK